MGWRTVIINTHSKLSYLNNHLIFRDRNELIKIHLSEIDILLLETTNITITTMLLKRLVDENILVLFCDDKRLPIGKLLPFYAKHDSSLQISKQINWTDTDKIEVWTEIISQKLVNQRIHLSQRMLDEKALSLTMLHADLQPFDPTNREGHAARIYFNALFGNQFTRDTLCDVNAGLDYGYTLLMSLFAREIVCTGCMTQFGLKHANQFNEFNLASDLMEPFRPLVDQIVYDNSNQPFTVIKRRLLDLFEQTYFYGKKEMYLNNIVSDYTKKVVKYLNNQQSSLPVFRL